MLERRNLELETTESKHQDTDFFRLILGGIKRHHPTVPRERTTGRFSGNTGPKEGGSAGAPDPTGSAQIARPRPQPPRPGAQPRPRTPWVPAEKRKIPRAEALLRNSNVGVQNRPSSNSQPHRRIYFVQFRSYKTC